MSKKYQNGNKKRMNKKATRKQKQKQKRKQQKNQKPDVIDRASSWASIIGLFLDHGKEILPTIMDFIHYLQSWK